MDTPAPSVQLPPIDPALVADLDFQRDQELSRLKANVERANELGAYTVTILKTTLDNAAKTYKRITLMNSLMFSLGFGLFLLAAVYGVLADEKVYSLAFAGMGAATFVALFLTGPIEKTQVALSNLVQVEISFMNFFEQITIWETYALAPVGDPPVLDPDKIETASASLQQRSTETVALLQKHVEPARSGG